MNKEELNEALKIIHEPITVNSVEYKYFDVDNYNKLVNVIDYCHYLNDKVKPYVEAQDKEIERLNNIIDKAIEYIKEKYEYVLGDMTFLDHDELIDRKQILKVIAILQGEDKE